MIFFSIRGKKYFGRVCKGWSEANIYVNVMYRFFKRRWDKGRYESDISMYSEFITDFFATLIHESLHILVKRLYGKFHSSENKIEWLTQQIIDKWKLEKDKYLIRFWLKLLSEIFNIPLEGGELLDKWLYYYSSKPKRLLIEILKAL